MKKLCYRPEVEQSINLNVVLQGIVKLINAYENVSAWSIYEMWCTGKSNDSRDIPKLEADIAAERKGLRFTPTRFEQFISSLEQVIEASVIACISGTASPDREKRDEIAGKPFVRIDLLDSSEIVVSNLTDRTFKALQESLGKLSTNGL